MENRHPNDEWYWNLNLHRDPLLMANKTAIENTMMPSSSAFYTSAVLTDIGICVGMRNVNLNGEQHQCFHSRKIPNCSENWSEVSKRNSETWKNAIHQYHHHQPTMSPAMIAPPTMSSNPMFSISKMPASIPTSSMDLYAHSMDTFTLPMMTSYAQIYNHKKINDGHFSCNRIENCWPKTSTDIPTTFPSQTSTLSKFCVNEFLQNIDQPNEYRNQKTIEKVNLLFSLDENQLQSDSCDDNASTNIKMSSEIIQKNDHKISESDLNVSNTSSSSSMLLSDLTSAPKKKWIRHYMLSN